jgi:two-component system NtrC family sensor kinase
MREIPEPDETPTDTTALVAGVAHEINNPITYVLADLAELERSFEALSETLARYRAELRALCGEVAGARIADVESKLDARGGLALARELLDETSEGARRIRDLVRDLLSLARAGERRGGAPLSVDEILEETLRLVARSLAGRVELVRDLEAKRSIEGDRARLGQVFLNLIANAIDACATAPERSHRLTVRTRDTAFGVVIEIEDTGDGIPAEIRARVFAPFFTTKPAGSGTGLGLYLSRRIVAAHGGTLTLEPSPTGGTVARVTLPEKA